MSTHRGLRGLEKYWTKVEVRGPNDCWLWTDSLKGCKYGLFWDGLTYLPNGHPKQVVSTRWGYIHRIGRIPEGQWVCHSCDVPACHNDAHWFLGTASDNQRDSVSKGRNQTPDNRGHRHGMAKLTIDQIEDIRIRYARGDVKQSDLATEFGIHQQQISRIVRRTSWR